MVTFLLEVPILPPISRDVVEMFFWLFFILGIIWAFASIPKNMKTARNIRIVEIDKSTDNGLGKVSIEGVTYPFSYRYTTEELVIDLIIRDKRVSRMFKNRALGVIGRRLYFNLTGKNLVSAKDKKKRAKRK